MSNKNSALQKIESHEKLCRIMQKQTHDRINQLQNQITRIERILLVSMGSVMTGMAGVIVVLIQKFLPQLRVQLLLEQIPHPLALPL